MLVKIVIAVMASALLMSSCEWLFPKKKDASASNIQGKWEFDSISSPRASGSGLAFLAPALTIKDRGRTGDIHFTCVFDTASRTVVSGIDGREPDIAAYTLDAGKMSIKLNDDEQVVYFIPVSDSSFVLKDNDSTVSYFSRRE